MTTEETRNILSIIRSNYPNSFTNMSREQSEVMLELWQGAFEKVPYEVVSRAVQDIIYHDTRDFAPNIGQVNRKIKEMLMPDAMDAAMAAWREALEAARSCWFEESADTFAKLPERTQRVLGLDGFRQLAMNTPEQNQIYEKQRFEKSYIQLYESDAERALEDGSLIEHAEKSKKEIENDEQSRISGPSH